jgi:hypothetical protein
MEEAAYEGASRQLGGPLQVACTSDVAPHLRKQLLKCPSTGVTHNCALCVDDRETGVMNASAELAVAT